MHAGSEVDDRRQLRVRGRARGGQYETDTERRNEAEPSELSAVLPVAEPQQRKCCVAEQLRDDPAADEERDRLPERRHDPGRVHQPDERAELDEAERHRRPAGLVAEPAVHLDVEEEPDAEHQRDCLDGPPPVLREREHTRRDHDR